MDDFVVKLLVMEELLADDELELPHDDAWEWLQASRGIDHAAAEELIYGEYYAKMVPEIEQWARDYVITDEHCASIESLAWDGGNEMFMLLAPSWDGEDDLFDAGSWAEVTPQRFPALTELVYQGDLPKKVRKPLEAAGVEVEEF